MTKAALLVSASLFAVQHAVAQTEFLSVSCGDVVLGNTDDLLFPSTYRFDNPRLQEVAFTTCDSESGTNFDTRIRLYTDASLTVTSRIGEDDDDRANIGAGCSSFEAFLRQTLITDTYYVEVTAVAGGSNLPFTLSVQCGDSIQLSPDSSIAVGGAILGIGVTYIILSTVLPCLCIAGCVFLCIRASQNNNRTTIVASPAYQQPPPQVVVSNQQPYGVPMQQVYVQQQPPMGGQQPQYMQQQGQQQPPPSYNATPMQQPVGVMQPVGTMSYAQPGATPASDFDAVKPGGR